MHVENMELGGWWTDLKKGVRGTTHQVMNVVRGVGLQNIVAAGAAPLTGGASLMLLDPSKAKYLKRNADGSTQEVTLSPQEHAAFMAQNQSSGLPSWLPFAALGIAAIKLFK